MNNWRLLWILVIAVALSGGLAGCCESLEGLMNKASGANDAGGAAGDGGVEAGDGGAEEADGGEADGEKADDDDDDEKADEDGDDDEKADDEQADDDDEKADEDGDEAVGDAGAEGLEAVLGTWRGEEVEGGGPPIDKNRLEVARGHLVRWTDKGLPKKRSFVVESVEGNVVTIKVAGAKVVLERREGDKLAVTEGRSGAVHIYRRAAKGDL